MIVFVRQRKAAASWECHVLKRVVVVLVVCAARGSLRRDDSHKRHELNTGASVTITSISDSERERGKHETSPPTQEVKGIGTTNKREGAECYECSWEHTRRRGETKV